MIYYDRLQTIITWLEWIEKLGKRNFSWQAGAAAGDPAAASACQRTFADTPERACERFDGKINIQDLLYLLRDEQNAGFAKMAHNI